MNPGLLISTAFGSVGANKLRAGLTLLGIVIGVSSVIAMMAVGRGAQISVTSRISELGTDLITVSPGAQALRFAFFGGGGNSDVLSLEDALSLKDDVFAPDVRLVAPENSFSGSAVVGSESTFVNGVGITAEYLEARNLSIASGRNITNADVENIALVAVLGSEVSETLFGQRNPVGATLKISSREFTVVGVLDSQEGTIFNPDNSILVPINTAHYRLNNGTGLFNSISLGSINVLASSEDTVDDARTDVSTVLRLRHELAADEDDDFLITTQQDTIETLEGTQGTFVILLGSIAGISLLVGGIGVMNIMLVSVTERTREIGIRRAVGAKRRDILFQFVAEAILMTFAGGILGVLAGWAIAYFGNGATVDGDIIETVIETHIAIIALGVSVAVGLFFGIYPAVRAASLNPIEALRHE
ncbi:MAG: ABC transporter permease [Dehalococcoidia bacterium]|jgi:putative ABC transport system permease protein|nr:ABC transporter permease [Dehalococcoidia bacterium]MDP7090898.1 ABC transporter permease [Dehalococcoidia bacterium]MDP7485722.1 ABC transporter permease [Dehalococcoidia bacterium]|tara:strand:- start:1733 stop:2983 length:1251 start_codon:yes stop_codon:yes gene_type:complete